ncbi:MAG: hypothetical protein ACOVO9_15040, partial [Bacteroidia bacterium]
MKQFKTLIYFLVISSVISCDESPKIGVYENTGSVQTSTQEKKEESTYSEWNGIWSKGKNHEIVTLN